MTAAGGRSHPRGFDDLDSCTEILNDTRPDVIETIHRNYFQARVEGSSRNTFGGNLVDLGDYDIADKISEPSLTGAAIAMRVCRSRR